MRELSGRSSGCFQVMAHLHHHTAWNRGGAALATLAVHLVLIAALIWGLGFDDFRQRELASGLAVTTFETPPPPPEPDPKPRDRDDSVPAPEGAEAAPVEAPPAAIPIAPPVAAADVAAEGQRNRSGTGDIGSGSGAGGAGTGDGSGGIATPARRIAGALRDSDYPRAAERRNIEGTVAISFRVRPDGRVDRCAITASSGHALLDDLTCRLFTQRFRFEPARTAAGRAVETTLHTSFTWGTRQR